MGAGDLKYKDFNGDGLIDGDDQHRIGKNGFPRANYGINFDVAIRAGLQTCFGRVQPPEICIWVI